MFGQGSIIEAVSTRLSRKYLPAVCIRFAQARPAFPRFRRNTRCIGSSAQKRRNDVAI